MYYIFFINNIKFGEKTWTPQEIMNSLLNRKIWAFSPIAPNLKCFAEGNRVVVYLAGKGNRFFAADFIIASKPYEDNPQPNDPEWLAMFPIRVDIRDIKLWSKQLSISKVLQQLEFIQDKKNYGLYFRQSTKKIDEKDFSSIVSAN